MLLSMLLRRLEAENGRNGIFNPWADYDQEYDIDPRAPNLRRQHLEGYLRSRLGRARHLLIAEGVGYQGARFSGIPLTSERMILGRHPVVRPVHVVAEAGPLARTSNPHHPGLNGRQRQDGFAEPTATILWAAILTREINPFDVVLWNIFPFHPYDPHKGPLSNRTPTNQEIDLGTEYAAMVIELFPTARITAIGAKASRALKQLGVSFSSVPHPANGHRQQFWTEFARIVKTEPIQGRTPDLVTKRGSGQ